jgi:phosphohistidine phosphatase
MPADQTNNKMTQTLYLLRHAKAEPWMPGINDFERKLSERGREHMQSLSDWAAANLSEPEAVMCSSSFRTRETLEPFLSTWPQLPASTKYLDEIYESTTGTLHALAENAFTVSDSIMMIGHNPGFEYLASAVLRDSDAAKIRKMATGTLAVIDFPKGYDIDCGEGVLREWITRKSVLLD